MDVQEILKVEFSGHVRFRERRPGILQIIAPLYHEDGDMVDIFLDLPARRGLPVNDIDAPVRISDHGMTLMRLSYTYDIDTPTKRRVLDRILSENGVQEENGRLFVVTDAGHLYPTLLQFAQTIAKVSSMQMFKREVVHNLFYENLNDFISSSLNRFTPEQDFQPLSDRDDLDVDWRFPMRDRDIFLYGVRDTSKARLVGLTCLEFQKIGLPFHSVIIHEDLESGLSKKDQRRITNIADKQFATLPDFMTDAERYFERELRSQRVV